MPAVTLRRRPLGERALISDSEWSEIRHRIRGILAKVGVTSTLDVAQEIMEVTFRKGFDK